MSRGGPGAPAPAGLTPTSSILVRDVVLDGRRTDVSIIGNRIAEVGVGLTGAAGARIIDCRGSKAMVPPFYNGHTHAAMTLLRGYAEDMELAVWLQDHIWPAEAQLTYEEIYWGSRLAMLEMIKSGTVFFNDMYWEQAATLRAAEDMGMRAEIGLLHLSGPDGSTVPRSAEGNAALLEAAEGASDRITLAHAPHAPYSVSRETLEKIADDSARSGWRVHIHVAETAREVDQSLATTGLTPVAYLDALNLVNERSLFAHCVHLDAADRAVLGAQGATIAHMPSSNLKLRSGFFSHQAALDAGVPVILGTDGAASNNSLSMLAEMKTAALLAKSLGQSAEDGRADAMLKAATCDAARAFGIDAGTIEPGRLADALLVDLNHHTMVADYSLPANLVYAADTEVVSTVICDGQVLMDERSVPGEEQIVAQAREACRSIAERAGRGA